MPSNVNNGTELRDNKLLVRAYIITRSGRYISRASILQAFRDEGIQLHFNTVLQVLKAMADEGLVVKHGKPGSKAVQWKIKTFRADQVAQVRATLDRCLATLREKREAEERLADASSDR